VPAAAVIPAPVAYIKVVAVEKLLVASPSLRCALVLLFTLSLLWRERGWGARAIGWISTCSLEHGVVCLAAADTVSAVQPCGNSVAVGLLWRVLL
jgi:hypothetical protein